MKKLLLSTITGLLSFSLHAEIEVEKFAGEVIWKSSQGNSGTYEIELDIEVHDEQKTVIKKRELNENTVQELQVTVMMNDDQLGKVVINDKEVGGGYCWPIYDEKSFLFPAGRVCRFHWQEEQGSIIEDGLDEIDGHIYYVGSRRTPAGDIITWSGTLDAVADEHPVKEEF